MSLRTNRRAVFLAGAAAVYIMAAPAIAQDMPAKAAVPDLDQKGEGVGDIVVTATKRETSLQKTPIAISVVSDAMMKDRHVQSLYGLADGGVPSLRVATFEAR